MTDSRTLFPSEGKEIAQRSAGAAMRSGLDLLDTAERIARGESKTSGGTSAESALALASVAQGWIAAAEAIGRLADQGVYIELEGAQQ